MIIMCVCVCVCVAASMGLCLAGTTGHTALLHAVPGARCSCRQLSSSHDRSGGSIRCVCFDKKLPEATPVTISDRLLMTIL